MTDTIAVLCPGQGAQRVGMGRAWADASPAARAVFDEADEVLGDSLGAPLSRLCFEGPENRLNQTDVSQPAIYACSVASWAGLVDAAGDLPALGAASGLSLGEYTALHLAGAFGFAEGLRLVAARGRLMQDAAEVSAGGMVALIGADEAQAAAVCEAAVAAAGSGEHAAVLVVANLNAPGQIVLSGHQRACDEAVRVAEEQGLRAAGLAVAGAFHSPLMQPAADRMAEALAAVDLRPPGVPVWSNVTGRRHDPEKPELLRRRLVEQIVSPVRWADSCVDLIGGGYTDCRELAPGGVLRGLMRRIDRTAKVTNHEEPPG